MRDDEQEETGNINTVAHGYIGTYDSENSRGIYHFTFDTESGRLTEPELFYEACNAKWVCTDGHTMVFPIEKQGCAGACFLTLEDGAVIHAAEILEETQTPCFILMNGGSIYTANYHEGNVMVYRVEGGRPVLLKRIENGENAGCHQILLHEGYLIVPCLEQNRIRLFDTADDFAPAGEITFPIGSGPRHGIFNRSHTMFYVVGERSNELYIFLVHGKEFRLIQSISVLPESWDGKNKGAAGAEILSETVAAAAVRLSADERFLYISVRGTNSLCVLNVSRNQAAVVIQHSPCGGDHPRDFVLSGDERFLVVANRFEGGIVSIERDRNSGLLGSLRHSVPMPEGVALILAPELTR